MYRISRARVNIAKKQFSNLSNEYEITFGQETEVEPVDEVRFELGVLVGFRRTEPCAHRGS